MFQLFRINCKQTFHCITSFKTRPPNPTPKQKLISSTNTATAAVKHDTSPDVPSAALARISRADLSHRSLAQIVSHLSVQRRPVACWFTKHYDRSSSGDKPPTQRGQNGCCWRGGTARATGHGTARHDTAWDGTHGCWAGGVTGQGDRFGEVSTPTDMTDGGATDRGDPIMAGRRAADQSGEGERVRE